MATAEEAKEAGPSKGGSPEAPQSRPTSSGEQSSRSSSGREPKPQGRQAPKVAYYVAPGKATRVGTKIVGPLTPVKPSDFEGGQADLDDLITRGVIFRGDLKKS